MKAPGILGLVLAALGGCCPYTPSECIAVVENACIVLDVEDPATVTADDLARIDAALVEGGRFWGVDPAHVLRGWTIVLHGSAPHAHCQNDRAVGCCDLPCTIIHLSPFPCIEAVAAHELGHVALDGDGSHTDPRWTTAPWGCTAS